jgi:hypothetical protein
MKTFSDKQKLRKFLRKLDWLVKNAHRNSLSWSKNMLISNMKMYESISHW